MKQLDPGGRGVAHGIVDFAPHRHSPHRHRRVGQTFGHRDQIGRDAKPFGRGCLAHPAERGDHFIEDQHDAVHIANIAQPLEIALRRDQHAGRSGHRFNNHRGDGFRAVQRHQPLKIIGKFGAVGRQPARPGVAIKIVGVAHVIDPGQQGSELAPVAHDPANRDPAKAHPVIAALAPDQTGPRALSARTLIGQRDLQRGIDAFGSGIGKEDPVKPRWHQQRKPRGGFERLRVRQLERRREIQFARRLADRLNYRSAAVPGVDAP